jgi:hypothetical protein
MRIVHALAVAVLAGGVLAGSPAARADDCDLSANAAIAQAKVPHGVTHVVNVPGSPPMRADMIVTGDTVYAEINGTWRSEQFSQQEQIDVINQGRQRAAQTPHTCRKVTGQSINGEAASLIVMHVEGNGKAVDSSVWISDKTGLPLKSEVKLDNGTVVTDDFRYGNIQPPPGVK